MQLLVSMAVPVSHPVLSNSATAWSVAHQAPPSMQSPRQESWSAWPVPPPGDLPDPGTEPRSPASQADSLPSEPPGKQGYQPPEAGQRIDSPLEAREALGPAGLQTSGLQSCEKTALLLPPSWWYFVRRAARN